MTKEQETFLDVVKHISNPDLQKEYLDKLLKTFDKGESSKTPVLKQNTYDLTQILSKKKNKKDTPSFQDLQKEIQEIKFEIKDLKEKQKNDSETIQLLLKSQLEGNSDEDPDSENDETKK